MKSIDPIHSRRPESPRALSSHFRRPRRLASAVLGALLALLPLLGAHAADLFVTNTADTGPGSLRQIIADSQDGDTIRFDLPTSDPGYDAATGSWTITLAQSWEPPTSELYVGRVFSQLVVEKNISIIGPGADTLTIRGVAVDGARSVVHRPLYISPGAVVMVSGLTFTKPWNGANRPWWVGGGAILNDSATLTLRDCIIRDTFTADQYNQSAGGAVLNGARVGPATMTVERCQFLDNRILSEGGAALANGHLEYFDAYPATMRVRHSTFTGNLSYGGTIWNGGGYEGQNEAPYLLEIEDCAITNNAAPAVHISAFYDPATTTRITRTTVTNNSSGLSQAPILHFGGMLRIDQSTISGNSVGNVGAIASARGKLEMTNSTISGNHPSQVSSNSSAGVIFFWAGTEISLRNCTIIGSSSPGPTFRLLTSGDDPARLHLSNSIIQRAPGSTAGHLSSPLPANLFVTSGAYNISDDDFGGLLTAAGDQPNTEPLLGPLQDNGGATKTHALLAGSPAINTGDPSFDLQSLPQDQRGYLRITGGRIDIGAFESSSYLDQPPVARAGADFSVNEGQSVTLDGSASSDPNLGVLTFAWAQVGGGTPVTLAGANTVSPRFTAPTVAPGGETLTFKLTVTAIGGSASDAVSVTVVNVNHAPVADAGVDRSIAEGSPVALDGSASFDSDADIFSYAWRQVSGPAVTLAGADTASPSFTAPYFGNGGAPGVVATLVFELLVDDGQPQNATSTDRVEIKITNTNNPAVAAAGPDQTVDENTGVMLDGSASSDPDSDALTYAWVQVANGSPSVVLSGAQTASPSFAVPFVNAGGAKFVFQLTVDDGYGSTATDLVAVHVQNRNDPPLATAARPTEASLWPPNHQMVSIGILGVSDPENNATITITGVSQDEPTNGQGDGDTAIDAIIQPNGTVLIRSERGGKGDGRVYRISFTARDAEGSSSGVVKVSVPHSNKKVAIEGSAVFDSTR